MSLELKRLQALELCVLPASVPVGMNRKNKCPATTPTAAIAVQRQQQAQQQFSNATATTTPEQPGASCTKGG